MSNEQELSNEKSMEIIRQMISQAKTNITDNGLGWLLWGSMIFLTSVATFVFIDTGAKNIYLAWNIFGCVTILLLLFQVFRPKKKKVRTYVDDVLKLVDLSFIISLFLIIFSMNVAVSPNAGFGFILMIFGILMLIHGGALRSRSLMVGAAVNWAGAIGIFVNKDFKYDMLIMAAAVLIGYIIPGLLLRAEYRKNKMKN
jgi:hypothetical protein